MTDYFLRAGKVSLTPCIISLFLSFLFSTTVL